MRHRQWKICLVLLACLFSSALACSELSELISLSDDVSNDYSCQTFSGPNHIGSIIANRSVTVSRSPLVRMATLRDSAAFRLVSAGVQRSAKDILHLLAVYRT